MSLHYGPGAAVGPGHMVKKVEESVPMENFAQRKHYLILERPRGTWTPLQIWGLAVDLNLAPEFCMLGHIILYFGGKKTLTDLCLYLSPLPQFLQETTM